MDEEEVAFLLLSRAKIANLPDIVEGSVVITANCGHKVFISPQGLNEQARRNDGLYTMCTDCVDIAEVIHDQKQEKAAVPGALDAVAKHFGWGVGQEDQFRATLRDHGFKDT